MRDTLTTIQYINYSDYRILDNDLDTKPIILQFAPEEVNKIARVLVNCDKESENGETFDIRLALVSNNSQVRTGRNKSIGLITDSPGKRLIEQY